MKKSVFLIFILILAVSFPLFAKDNICFGDGYVSNVKVYVFQKKWIDYFTDGSFENNSERKILATKDILKTKQKISDLYYYDVDPYFFAKSLLSFKSNGKQQKYNWNQISITYNFNDNYCIISLPFNRQDYPAQKNRKINIFINGKGYDSDMNLVIPLFYPLIDAKLLPEDFMTYY
jgi:hypothetical protein